MHDLPIGRSEILREGDDVAIIALGSMVLPAERAADALLQDGIQATVANARFAKPLDAALILELSQRCRAIVTVEENVGAGGFGSAVLELLAARGISLPVRTLAVPGRIFDHASQNRLREQAGLTSGAIRQAAIEVLKQQAARFAQPPYTLSERV
jgi:1-deoxy-D-xylulose-5-phosphate synthase